MNRFVLTACSLLVFQGCVSVDWAREAAAQHSCNWQNKCGDVGAGKTYASLDECLTKQRASWLDAWPTASCDGKINVDKFNACLTAIDNTSCSNGFDQLATFLGKCPRSEVCSVSGGGCNCSNGQTCCNNACTNLQTDRDNCGGCGTSCGPGLSCQSGVCR